MSGFQVIEASQLHAMLEHQPILLVDVRNDDEVARGIIPGAVHIPLSMIPAAQTQLQTEHPIVFYCHSGIRSAQAANFIAPQHDQPVYNLQGGILAWGRAGYTFV